MSTGCGKAIIRPKFESHSGETFQTFHLNGKALKPQPRWITIL